MRVSWCLWQLASPELRHARHASAQIYLGFAGVYVVSMLLSVKLQPIIDREVLEARRRREARTAT